MMPNVCYIEWDPAKVTLKQPFRNAIQPAVQEQREGYIRVCRTKENVTSLAEKHGQTGLKITSGQVLAR
jgi:hypothetical protein